MSCARILQDARKMQGVSQFELALRLGVSQRHVSFVETGRARPSRTLIVQWIREAGAPSHLLGPALRAAGYANDLDPQRLPRRDADAQVNAAAAVLATQSPFPVVVFNEDWTIRGLNDAGGWLAGELMPGCWQRAMAATAPVDMIDTAGDRDGLIMAMSNPAEAAASLLGQLEVEALRRTELRDRVDAFADSVRSRWRIPPRAQLIADMRTSREFAFAHRIGKLRFLTVQSVLGHADSTAPGLRIEQWLPADRETRQAMLRAALDYDF